MNRRVAAVRGLFEYLQIIGARTGNPVPAARRSSGLRAPRRGLLGHLGRSRRRAGGQLVRQPRRLPEALDPADVSDFSPICARVGTGRSCWPWCWAGCAARRSAHSDWPMWTWACGGCAWSAREQGTGGAGRRCVLRRVCRLPARGATPRLPHGGVLRGAARPQRRSADDRGRAAQSVSQAPGHVRRAAGETPPIAPHLRHRIRPRAWTCSCSAS